MDITELLITAYHGDDPVLAVSLSPRTATTVLTGTDLDDQITVEDMTHQSTDVFTTIRELLQGLYPDTHHRAGHADGHTPPHPAPERQPATATPN